MTRKFQIGLSIIAVLTLLASNVFSQSFLASYSIFCRKKIDTSIKERVKVTSNLNTVTNGKVTTWKRELNERLAFQLEKLKAIFYKYQDQTGYSFNDADSLTIIYNTDQNSGFSNYVLYTTTDTLRSKLRLVLEKEVHNGGGRLEIRNKHSFDFTIRKINNKKMNDAFLRLSLPTDTAFAYHSIVYSPVDRGANSIIITAKKISGKYIIEDYYLHQYGFAVLAK
jgi:hypothetical protein